MYKEIMNYKYRNVILLVLILIFALILRLVFFTGIGPSDSMSYAEISYKLSKGQFTLEGGLSAYRIGIFFPVAAIYSIFGVNDFSSNFFVLSLSLASIILIFKFGKMLFNEKTGLIAAFLLSFFPLDIIYATRLNTDLSSAFFVALAVYLFLKSERINKKATSNIYNLIAGLSFGIAYLIKELSLLIGLFFIIYTLYKKKIKISYLFVIFGFVLIFSLELWYFLSLTGNPFFRYTGVGHELNIVIETENYGRGYLPLSLFHYPYIIFTDNLLSLFYVFTFIAILYSIVLKKRETYVVMFWFIPLLLYLSFGTESLTQYVPIPAATRFLFLLNFPGILLLAHFLSENEPIIKKILMPGIIIILLTTSVGYTYLSDYRFSLDDERDAYTYLKTLPEKITYTDHRTIRIFNYLSGFENDENVKTFNKYVFLDPEKTYVIDLSQVNDAYIAINRDLIEFFLSSKPGIVFPKQIDSIPEDWILQKKIRDGNIEIYYVP